MLYFPTMFSSVWLLYETEVYKALLRHCFMPPPLLFLTLKCFAHMGYRILRPAYYIYQDIKIIVNVDG